MRSQQLELVYYTSAAGAPVRLLSISTLTTVEHKEAIGRHHGRAKPTPTYIHTYVEGDEGLALGTSTAENQQVIEWCQSQRDRGRAYRGGATLDGEYDQCPGCYTTVSQLSSIQLVIIHAARAS